MNYVKIWIVIAISLLTCAGTVSAQLLNTTGQVWKNGSPTDPNYIELQVTEATATTFSGTASFRRNGQWIGTQELAFTGIQVTKAGGIADFDGTCNDGTKFAGWLFPGPTAGTNTDDRVCIYFLPVNISAPPCGAQGLYFDGVLQANSL